MSRGIWIIESSIDCGQTWDVEQQYGMYKSRQRAEGRVGKQLRFYKTFDEASIYRHMLMRATEYKPVEVSR